MYSRTALIYKPYFLAKNKYADVYRYRSCDTNLTSNTQANQYQRLKIIQNTVRVPSSIYTMNLAALNAYEAPSAEYQIINAAGTNYLASPGVNWNQMSDRSQPHTQTVISGSGSTYGASSVKRTITRLRPGALSPGGSGVDIKHNSYNRYLNRIKGRAPLRRGVIPPNFGAPIPFNPAFPVYGGKTLKTNIINNCDCPGPKLHYDDSYTYPEYHFYIGQTVSAVQFFNPETGCVKYANAVIIEINGVWITIQFNTGVIEIKNQNEIEVVSTCGV